MTIEELLESYRKTSETEREKGAKFERLMKNFLLTYPQYLGKIDKVWLWNEFPARAEFGGADLFFLSRFTIFYIISKKF